MGGGETVSSEWGKTTLITRFADGAEWRRVCEGFFERVNPEGRRTNCPNRPRQGWGGAEEGRGQPRWWMRSPVPGVRFLTVLLGRPGDVGFAYQDLRRGHCNGPGR